ncbi:hypothetical protein JTB14_022335 [Gonioctena quinquepunctata]|nr:hypothetical protein JTB14_022335 [Gonioctena quinquepunctata]
MFSGNGDEEWEATEHEEQTDRAEEMDVEQEKESSDEDQEYDDEDNIPQSHFLTWQKSQFLSKLFADDTIEEDYTVNILSHMGYLEKYLPE